KRTLQRIGHAFGSRGQTLDPADLINLLNPLGQSLDSTQVSRRSNIARRYREDKLRLRRKLLFDLPGLLDSGITGGEEEVFIHYRLEIDKHRHEDEEGGRDRKH